MMSSEETTQLTTGKYTIKQDKGAAVIYTTDEGGEMRWLASTTDPNKAMEIVEGLILVEHKRFYKPEATPVFVSGNDRPLPPFLKRNKSS
jgi:hypothetical protein